MAQTKSLPEGPLCRPQAHGGGSLRSGDAPSDTSARLGEHATGHLGLEYRHLELVHETVDRDQYGDMGLDIGSLIVSYRPDWRP